MSIIDIIKYEGDNQTFIWKHPSEDFNTASQLIVHETQEAYFYLNGQVLDAFGAGRHTLETQNIPLINKVINIPSDGETPFHAEVYFVNLTQQMGISWGTNSKVQYMEPEYHFPLSIGASGEMALAVRDGKKLLIKLVGTEALLSQNKLVDFFKMFLQARIKTALVSTIQAQRLNIFELDAHLEDLSSIIKSKLIPDFEEYGIELTQILITTIVRPTGDPLYEEFKQLYFRQYADIRNAEIEQQTAVINAETEAKQKVIDAKAEAEKRQVEGYTYQQQRGFDVVEKIAENEAVGEFSNIGIGLGMMTGVGAPIGTMVSGAMTEAMGAANLTEAAVGTAVYQQSAKNYSQKFCPECGRKFETDEKYCPECGTERE